VEENTVSQNVDRIRLVVQCLFLTVQLYGLFSLALPSIKSCRKFTSRGKNIAAIANNMTRNQAEFTDLGQMTVIVGLDSKL
jgi:hypothetical protein